MQGQLNCEAVRVLLVEDNPSDARMVQLVLSQARGAMEVCRGLSAVTHVSRLEQALDLLSGSLFDAVLLDLRLPDSDGMETLSQVRDAAPDVPVIVLTGTDDDALALKAIEEGAQDYLAKECLDGRLLRRIIRHAIERKRAELELRSHTRQVENSYTRIEQRAAELQARAEQLDLINRELDDFTFVASHDLKEPLLGIRGYCEILLEDYEDKLDLDGRQRLNALTRMCTRLEESIESLLAYSRVGQTESLGDSVDLNVVAAEVLETLRPVIGSSEGVVSVASLPTVKGNAALIGKVFSNLISNGLKFNRNSRPRVRVGCAGGSPPVIFVRDNGIGIASEHHEEIFAIFRRLHSRREYEGSGAGLTIVRKIVESHGGQVWLESELGRGTAFYFTLVPVSEEAAAAVPLAKPPYYVRRSRRTSA